MAAYGQQIIVIKEELDKSIIYDSGTATGPQSLARPGPQDSTEDRGKYAVKTSDTDDCRKYLHHRRADSEERHHSSKESGRSSRSNSLHGHVKIRTGEKPHICKECGKAFSSHLHRHARVHTGEKPYVCNECGKSFSDRSNLHSHRRVHTGERPHVCEQCGKSFSRSSTLRIHRRVHTGEKPYVCTECGKSFAYPNSLRTHGRVHTGENQHVCKQYGKSFSDSSALHTHRRVHMGEKSQVCVECGKSFSSLSSLCTNSRLHTVHKCNLQKRLVPCKQYLSKNHSSKSYPKSVESVTLMDALSVADSTRHGVSQNERFLGRTQLSSKALKPEPPDDTFDKLAIFKPSTSFRNKSDHGPEDHDPKKKTVYIVALSL